MQDPALVRGLKRAGDLEREPQRFCCFHWSLERSALDVFQHQVIRADIVDLANVRMVQRRNGTRLQFESGTMLMLQTFDGDEAIQPGVAGFPHLSHCARADEGQDFVRAEFVAYGEGHGNASDKSTRANSRKNRRG